MKNILLILGILILLTSCGVKEKTEDRDYVRENYENKKEAIESWQEESSEPMLTHDGAEAFIAKKIWNHFNQSYIYIVGKSGENEYEGCGGFRSRANCYFYKSDNSRVKNFAEAEYIGNINPGNIDEDFNITFLNENEIHYNSGVGDGGSASVWSDTLNLVTGKISRESYSYNNNEDGETVKTGPFYDEFELEKDDSDRDYIGMTEDKAKILAEENNVSFRVVERDGEPQPATKDYRVGRINATVNDGVISSYQVEGK